MFRHHPLNSSSLPVRSQRPVRTIVVGLLAVAVGWMHSTAVKASGISTHFEAADRAVAALNASTHPDLAATLNHWPETVRVGAVYPDWGYLWGRTSDAAEDAHWQPFHTTALEYLHNQYGEPWSVHAERLFCFISGMACHGTMDDAWHFGGTSFLKQAIARDLPDWEAGQAEMVIETLTDLFVQADHRHDYETEKWWVPADDLVAIHQLAGHSIARGAIIRGTTIQRIAFLIENIAWVFALEPAEEMLPWTRANYLTWYDGGVINGADLSAVRMQNLWDEYLVIAASQPSGGNNSSGGGSGAAGYTDLHNQGHANTDPHNIHVPRQIWLEAAERLLDDDAIRVPLREVAGGAIELGVPTIVDHKKMLREIIKISRSR